MKGKKLMKYMVIGANWADEGTSKSHESLLVEVENALHNASNVLEFYAMTNSHQDEIIGFAIKFRNHRKDFFVVEPTGEVVLMFTAEGDLRSITAPA